MYLLACPLVYGQLFSSFTFLSLLNLVFIASRTDIRYWSLFYGLDLSNNHYKQQFCWTEQKNGQRIELKCQQQIVYIFNVITLDNPLGSFLSPKRTDFISDISSMLILVFDMPFIIYNHHR